MKKLIFSSLIGLALVAFTGCYGPTADKTVETQRCQADKKTTKCGTSSKCGDAKEVTTKCNGSSKGGK
jgi:hypothetical protein